MKNFRYMDGIKQEVAAGRITYSKKQQHDKHTHLPPRGAYSFSNMHRFDGGAHPLLREDILPKSPKILVLGPGIGIECKKIRELASNALIHTCSLSPFDPSLTVRMHPLTLYERVDEMIAPRVLRERQQKTCYWRTVSGNVEPGYHNTYVPTDLIIELENAGRLQVHTLLTHPCADHQYIGPLTAQDDLPGGNHMIYDNCGPIEKDNQMNNDNASLKKALELLDPTGVLYIATYEHDVLSSGCHFRDRELLLQGPGYLPHSVPRCAIFKEGHPLYKYMLKILRSRRVQAVQRADTAFTLGNERDHNLDDLITKSIDDFYLTARAQRRYPSKDSG